MASTVTTRSSSRAPTDARLDELSREHAELLEQQTATNEVIRAIGRSGFELRPIFETVVDHAMRLCRADAAQIRIYDGGHYPTRLRIRWLGGIPSLDRCA